MTRARVLRLLFVVLVAVFFNACSFFPARHFPARHFPLSSVSVEAQNVVAQQQWQLSYEKKLYSLQVIIERTPIDWQWIMLNNLGQRLATARVIGTELNIQYQQSHPANALVAELLEAVEFSYWPIRDLQNSAKSGWTFTESKMRRDIYFSGILRASVNYESENLWQGRLSYENKKRNFQLLIESQLVN